MFNRAQRREMQKRYRKGGMTKAQAKEMVNTYYRTQTLKPGQKCKINYEFIIRHPEYKNQNDEFKQWIEDHKNEILTVEETRDEGREVTFKEDENKKKFWHHTETLIPVASAQVKLDNGTTKTVVLENVNDVNDPAIMTEVNKALESEDSDVSSN